MINNPNNTIDSNKAINIASIATIFASFQLIIFNSYLVIFLEADLLISALIVSIIVSMRNLLQLFLRVPLSELTDVIGRKPLILTGHFSYSIALILLVFATDWFLGLLATAFIAIGMASFWPAILGFIGDYTPDSFGHSNGRIFQGSDIGIILASLASKILLDFIGITLIQLFGIIFLIGVVSGIILAVFLPESLTKQKRDTSIARSLITSLLTMPTSIKNVTIKPGMKEIYSFQLILSFTEFMVTTFLPVLIVARGFSRGTVSEVIFYTILITLWFKPKIGIITDKTSFIKLITIFNIVIGLIISLFVLIATNLIIFIGLTICYNLAVVINYTAINGETSRRAPMELKETALGTLGFYVSLGRGLSTLVLGLIWIINLEAVFIFTTIIVIITTLGLNWIFQRNGYSKQSNLVKLTQ